MSKHRLKKRYGHAGQKHGAVARDFLRWMPGWWVTKEDGSNLVVYKMASVQGQSDGPKVAVARINPRSWFALGSRAGHGSTPRAALEDAGVKT